MKIVFQRDELVGKDGGVIMTRFDWLITVTPYLHGAEAWENCHASAQFQKYY